MIKYLGLLSGFLFFALAGNAQEEKECNKVKTGTFRSAVRVEGREVVSMIYRKKNKQVEENAERGIRMEFVVKWTSPCSYELSEPKVVKGEFPGVSPDQVLYVKILSVTRDTYTAEVSGNFFEGATIMDFMIVK